MTTTVTVQAHCADTKQVRISRTGFDDAFIHDGEKYESVVYDDISITVIEEEKTPC
jgi:hypothetical protein